MNTEKFFESPGNSDMATYVWELALILAVAFILGYLLRVVLNEGVKKRIVLLEEENAKLYNDAKKYEMARSEIEKSEIRFGEQKRELDKLNDQLSACYAARLKVENALFEAQSTDGIEGTTTDKHSDYPTDELQESAKQETAGDAAALTDDLKKIEGIGPKIEQLLNNDGVKNYRDIIGASEQRIKGILTAAGPNYAVHDPSTWAEQAELANEGNWEALALLQEDLKGGKRK